MGAHMRGFGKSSGLIKRNRFKIGTVILSNNFVSGVIGLKLFARSMLVGRKEREGRSY